MHAGLVTETMGMVPFDFERPASSWRLSRRRLLVLDLTLPQDRLDTGNLSLRLDDLARSFEPLGFALEAEPEQIVLDLLEEKIELLVGLVAEFGWLGHRENAPKPGGG
jgi:hypothetical protein